MLRRTATPADRDHCDVVCAFQDQLTTALCARLLRLAEDQKADAIVVTGGVAMNCLAMGELQRRFGGKVFIPPAPSDTGQGLGNAVWASSCISSPCFSPEEGQLDLPDAPFWGVPCNEISPATMRLASHHGLVVIENHSERDQFHTAAQALADGRLVAIAMGRSEYGPRALGRRSVLADPRDPQSPLRVNRFKQREAYRPFAPAILQEHVSDYFEWRVDSPFMSFAVNASSGARERIPAVIHADGTARVQTVAKDSHSPLRPILEHFYRLAGVPVLVNTSFNRKGEPMVETPTEAVNAFIHSELDLLLLNGVTIQREEHI
jgi:carbamoyltransferase